MIAPDTETSDTQVIAVLHEHYQKFPKISRNFALATKVTHTSSGHGDRGWGCGYRNIQMMCSSLSEAPHFKRTLFGGIGYIPSIPVLQQCLEAAWADGYDPDTNHKFRGVFGGNRWIGTYDAVSMLRYFGVRMELQTFHAARRGDRNSAVGVAGSKTSKSSSHGVHVIDGRGASSSSSPSSSSSSFPGLVSRVVSTVASTFKYMRFQPAMFVPHVEMFKWVWNYFETRVTRGDAVIPPLYLQHDGHSRTIVGAENVNGRIALIIFDPSFPPKDVCQQLLSQASVPDVLRKTLSEFRHENYQIAYVKDASSPVPQENRTQFKTVKQGASIVSS